MNLKKYIDILKNTYPFRTIGIELFMDAEAKFLCIKLYNYTIYIGRDLK